MFLHWPRSLPRGGTRRKQIEKILKEVFVKYLDTWQGADPATTIKHHIKIETTLLLAAVRKAVDESTPWTSPSAWSNPDFDKECSEVVKEARRIY
jgi:hypothetical protein